MSNFYGKRFLSSLVGALSVLGSPVASARDDKLGKGNLKGEVESSASRDKNNGKLGGLKSNRKVKDVENLKKVLEETGGEVVGVSPDGKGGFVAFIKTPTGAVVTVAIVSVPLAVIIYCLVCFGRKNEVKYIKDEGSDEVKSSGIKDISDKAKGPEIKNISDEVKSSKIKNIEEETPKFVVENATGGLLTSLFKGKGKEYDSFVLRLLNGFFSDKSGVLKVKFDDCKGDLDGFLESVFDSSTFDGGLWQVNGVSDSDSAVVQWDKAHRKLIGFNKKEFGASFGSMFYYLSDLEFVKLSTGGDQAVWGDKISAVLFSFWCLCNIIDLGGEDNADANVKLGDNKEFVFEDIFNVIKGYVEERLKRAGKGYDGQKL